MATQREIPTDWFTRYGQETIDQLVEIMKQSHLNERSYRFHREYIDKGENRLSITGPTPLQLRCALKLYNTPAFFYTLFPKITRREIRMATGAEHTFTLAPHLYLRRAFEHLQENVGKEISCEHKDPFALIRLEEIEYSHFESWIGLGVESDLDPTEAREAQEEDLASLIEQHRELCDLVQERARQPLTAEEEHYLNHCKCLDYEKTVPGCRVVCRWNLKRNMHPVVSPICRAVLILGTEILKKDGRVLLVLTGDNGALLGPAPSFDIIPPRFILARRSENVVEVSLYRAVEYLRRWDAEEEKANDNDVLRRTTEKRIEAVTLLLQEEASNRVHRLWEDEEWDFICDGEARDALWQVMDRASGGDGPEEAQSLTMSWHRDHGLSNRD